MDARKCDRRGEVRGEARAAAMGPPRASSVRAEGPWALDFEGVVVRVGVEEEEANFGEVPAAPLEVLASSASPAK